MAESLVPILIGSKGFSLGPNRYDGGDYGEAAAASTKYLPQSLAAEFVYSGRATAVATAAPTTTSATPATAATATGRYAVTLVGTNYVRNSVVLFDGVVIPHLHVTATGIVCLVDTTGVTAGAHAIKVRSFKTDEHNALVAVDQAVATVFTIT